MPPLPKGRAPKRMMLEALMRGWLRPGLIASCLLFVLLIVMLTTVTDSSAADLQSTNRPVSYRELEEPRVAAIHFEHVQEKPFGNPELRAAMQTRIGQRLQRRYFRSDVTKIINIYRAAGFMDAQVVERRFALDADDRLHIYLRIASGTRWHVGSVRIDQLDSVRIDTTNLRKKIRVEAKGAFRYGRVLEDERRLLSWLNQEGHPHATVQNRIDFSRSTQAANVRYEVVVGRRMVFGALHVEGSDSLQTRQSLIQRQLTFSEGDLYDPEHLRRTRSNLARTGLFRSVIFATPVETDGDSIQPVILRLQERPYLHVESRAFASTEDLGLTGNVEHRNFLGRGNRIGADASFGRPLQGATLYLTERNLFDSPADLTLSAGMTDEFSSTQVFADGDDPRQFGLLTGLHTPALKRQRLLGDSTAAAYIDRGTYDYPSVQRLWQLDATLGRNWYSRSGSTRYLTQMSMNWTLSRRQPVTGEEISFKAEEDGAFAVADSVEAEGQTEASGEASIAPTTSVLRDTFAVDDDWVNILTNEARALNFRIDMERDTRDHPIMSRSGAFVRAEALVAVEFGGASTRVLDGTLEARHYQPLGDRFVWAQALTFVMTGSIRRDRQLPQTYWKSFGGEGSVRGIKRDAIQAVDGGRAGINVRNELRVDVGPVGVVGFWDRAGVWRDAQDAAWDGMRDGYGFGLRWDVGLPLRFDAGWSGDREDYELYLSIGQAF
ncbi:MAG: BamA/TamA family outer membrane protein [Gemmatimonadetes bacterium]|jgi:outer membrane protein assembly factor BamA|nr:BamA/TamA family outer membrane protein [Gemmatimonadota bacterium]MBT5589087.1 BamA/TamA family outer membrane protein [Gemmatimonadota bacterium]MBT7863850.1 BamA/TamA family outer membrane protein [Gemmatimonadota bacterium]